MGRYRKFLVAVTGAVLVALNQFFDIDIPYTPEGVTEVIITVATAIGVERVPNA